MPDADYTLLASFLGAAIIAALAAWALAASMMTTRQREVARRKARSSLDWVRTTGEHMAVVSGKILQPVPLKTPVHGSDTELRWPRPLSLLDRSPTVAAQPLLVLHSTEGWSIESAVSTMKANRSMSHTVYDPATNREEVLVDWHDSARSLRNASGGVETNRRGRVYQVEIVGFASRMRDYDSHWYDNLANYLRNVCRELDVPLDFPYDFIPYNSHPPSSYGADNGVRLNDAEWDAASGIVGHMHVPENTHGDPGDITPLIERLQPGREKESYLPAGSPPSVVIGVSSDPEVREFQELYQQAPAAYAGKIDGDFGPLSLQATKDMRAARIASSNRHEVQLAVVESMEAELAEAADQIKELEERLASRTAETDRVLQLEAEVRRLEAELAAAREGSSVVPSVITSTWTEAQIMQAASRAEWFADYLNALIDGADLFAPGPRPSDQG